MWKAALLFDLKNTTALYATSRISKNSPTHDETLNALPLKIFIRKNSTQKFT